MPRTPSLILPVKTITATIAGLFVLLLLTSSCSDGYKSQALYNQAMIALDQGLDGAAVEYLTLFIVRYPESPRIEEALFQRGTIYHLYQSRYLDAVNDFRELLERFPKGSRAMESRLAIAEILEKKLGDCRLAIVQYQYLISDYDTVVENDLYQYRISQCYYNLMNFDQAILEYEFLIDNYPASPLIKDAYFQIATVLQTAADLEEAEKAWRRYLVRYPDGKRLLDAKFGLASTLEEMEELQEALAIYQEIFDDYDNKEALGWRIEKVRERLKIRRR
ncbi:tetratricopeptide repeat protein [bacterium]|nr:MAG: tetratricopeptide repeat protein [bacterium]